MTTGQPPDPNTPDGARALGLVLDHMSDLVAMLDTDGRRLYNSPSYQELFGDNGLAGTDSFRDIHPEDRERVRGVFRDTVATGVGRRIQYRFLLEDGSIRYIESQGDVIKDSSGRVTRVVVVARDITERKKAELALLESNTELRATVEELEQRNRDNAALGRLGDLMQMCTSAAEARGLLAQYAAQLFPGASGNLYLRNFANDLQETVAAWGETGPAGDPVIGHDDCWALRRGKLHAVGEPDSKLLCPHLMVPPAGPCVCAPIMGMGEVLGMLHVQLRAADAADATLAGPVRARRFESLQAWTLTVAEHVALALANLRLREALRVQAVHDSLTGLYNRRYMEQALEREILRAARNGRSLGVIMVDLDHFKKFNDTHGHEAGDQLLRVLGDYLVTHVRAEDIACRYGGEEFVIILPEASPEMSRSRAQELWKGVQGLHVNYHGALLRGVTASLGVASFPANGRTMAELLRAADAAMYSAKRQGRDRVAVAELK